MAGVLTALLVAAPGCAFVDAHVERPHPRQLATHSRRGEGHTLVLLRPFTDQRSERTCGMKKNGFNVETAQVHCTSDPAKMLATLIAAELSAVGFTVLDDPGDASPSTLVLEGVLWRLFAEPKVDAFNVTVETDILLRLVATTPSGLSAVRTFSVKGEQPGLIVVEADFQRSFDSAVRQMVNSVVGAVANLAETLPADGSAQQGAAP